MKGVKNMLKAPYECWNNERYYEHNAPLNPEASKYLLITVKRVLESHDILIMPMFGTLLGAIREHGFIKNDTDVDTVIFAKDIPLVFDLQPELENLDIHLHCYVLPWILTFEYQGATCDLYPIYESAWPWTSRYYLLMEKYINKKYFDSNEDYELFGEIFKIPANPERLLAYLYGSDWRVPQNKKAEVESRLFFWRHLYRFMRRCMRYAKRHILKRK